MRLFIAVNISQEIKDRIIFIQTIFKKSSADVRWITPDNLHLTLKFLGEVSDSKIAIVTEKVKQSVAGVKKFEVDFGGVDVFPDKSFPRILWLGVTKGKNELASLAQKIDNSLEEIGFEKEKRQFSAHLTIGRIKSHKNKEKLFSIVEKTPADKISDVVEFVYLMKSTLTPQGSIYDVVEKFQLEGK